MYVQEKKCPRPERIDGVPIISFYRLDDEGARVDFCRAESSECSPRGPRPPLPPQIAPNLEDRRFVSHLYILKCTRVQFRQIVSKNVWNACYNRAHPHSPDMVRVVNRDYPYLRLHKSKTPQYFCLSGDFRRTRIFAFVMVHSCKFWAGDYIVHALKNLETCIHLRSKGIINHALNVCKMH